MIESTVCYLTHLWLADVEFMVLPAWFATLALAFVATSAATI